MCHNSILRQKFLMNANGRPSCNLVTRNEGTKKLKSRSQHLNSLEKLIIPVYLLEIHDVVVVKELPEIFYFEFPVFLRGKNRSNETPSVPSDTSQTSVREVATRIPTCSTRLYLRWLKSIPPPTGACGSRRSASLWFVVGIFRRGGKVWIDRTLHKDPLANPGTWAPLVSMWWP